MSASNGERVLAWAWMGTVPYRAAWALQSRLAEDRGERWHRRIEVGDRDDHVVDAQDARPFSNGLTVSDDLEHRESGEDDELFHGAHDCRPSGSQALKARHHFTRLTRP